MRLNVHSICPSIVPVARVSSCKGEALGTDEYHQYWQYMGGMPVVAVVPVFLAGTYRHYRGTSTVPVYQCWRCLRPLFVRPLVFFLWEVVDPPGSTAQASRYLCCAFDVSRAGVCRPTTKHRAQHRAPSSTHPRPTISVLVSHVVYRDKYVCFHPHEYLFCFVCFLCR